MVRNVALHRENNTLLFCTGGTPRKRPKLLPSCKWHTPGWPSVVDQATAHHCGGESRVLSFSRHGRRVNFLGHSNFRDVISSRLKHVVIVTPPTLVVGFHFAALDFPSRIEQSIFRTQFPHKSLIARREPRLAVGVRRQRAWCNRAV
jgi:hypothetical protein